MCAGRLTRGGSFAPLRMTICLIFPTLGGFIRSKGGRVGGARDLARYAEAGRFEIECPHLQRRRPAPITWSLPWDLLCHQIWQMIYHDTYHEIYHHFHRRKWPGSQRANRSLSLATSRLPRPWPLSPNDESRAGSHPGGERGSPSESHAVCALVTPMQYLSP